MWAESVGVRGVGRSGDAWLLLWGSMESGDTRKFLQSLRRWTVTLLSQSVSEKREYWICVQNASCCLPCGTKKCLPAQCQYRIQSFPLQNDANSSCEKKNSPSAETQK
uniref:Uncharacterized protein n=1 Tax=Percolomonas cosmopolitus TaxID=63605 RepID=A0A7S1KPM3_9EUKA